MQTRSHTSLRTRFAQGQSRCLRERGWLRRGIRMEKADGVSWRYGLILVLGWLAGATSQVSCSAHRRAAPGRSVLTAYLHAVEANQPDRVYAMLDETYRKKVSLKLFRKLWKTYRPELQADARKMRTLLEHPGASKKGGSGESSLVVGASGTLPGKGRVVLSWHKGRWVIVSGPGTELAGAGVMGTLLMLVKVLEARDFQGFLSMLSVKSRAAFLRSVSVRLTRLKSWMSGPGIQTKGDRVRIYYGATFYVDLVRENGRWRIEDFN